jgi:SMC interacting uncharacterized protein involved in chromosome segregation
LSRHAWRSKLDRVDQDELLRRLDAHMERGNEIMAENRRVIEANMRAFDRNTRVVEATLRAMEDRMAENRRAMEESRRAIETSVDTLEATARAYDGLRIGLGDFTQALRQLVEEFRSEMRAERQALFRILDRLDGKGQPGAESA